MTPYELFYNSFIKNHVFYTIQLLNTIWLFIELALCIYKGFAAVYFVRAFCGGKNNGKLIKPRNIFIFASLLTDTFNRIFLLRNV